jgi:hypothetical protein
MRRNYLLPVIIALLASGCAPATPDYGPIGSGLTALGICLVVYGVVRVLGELVCDKPPDSKPPRRKPNEPRDQK